MFNICGTFNCDTSNGFIGLCIYVICVVVILITLYFNSKFIWYAFFKHFVSVVTFILLVWSQIKFYLCYCGNFSTIILFIINSLISTFIVPITIVSLLLGENFLVYLKKIYKKTKEEFK